MILCCLLWYISLNCWSYFSSCLLLWSYCSSNIFSLLAKEQIKSFCCLSINILCCLKGYVSLNFCSSSSYCLLLWHHFLKTSPVRWLRNQSRVFVHIFDYMEDLWLHVLNRRLGPSQDTTYTLILWYISNIFIVGIGPILDK